MKDYGIISSLNTVLDSAISISDKYLAENEFQFSQTFDSIMVYMETPIVFEIIYFKTDKLDRCNSTYILANEKNDIREMCAENFTHIQRLDIFHSDIARSNCFFYFINNSCCNLARDCIFEAIYRWDWIITPTEKIRSWIYAEQGLYKPIKQCVFCDKILPKFDKIGVCDVYTSKNRFRTLANI